MEWHHATRFMHVWFYGSFEAEEAVVGETTTWSDTGYGTIDVNNAPVKI